MEMKTAEDKWKRRSKWAQSLRWKEVFCFQAIRAELVRCVHVCARVSVRETVEMRG